MAIWWNPDDGADAVTHSPLVATVCSGFAQLSLLALIADFS